jgi:hypothetical protein
MTTQADFYTTKYAGCWRIARIKRHCLVPLCLNHIQPGERYFDTMQLENPRLSRRTKILCATCANKNIG